MDPAVAGLSARFPSPRERRRKSTLICECGQLCLPGMPNSGIARGSVFASSGPSWGRRIWAAGGLPPLTANLGGTSIRVTVGDDEGGRTIAVCFGRASGGVSFPRIRPEGHRLMEVTYNGHTGQAGAFRVVRSSPGVLAQNQAGSGFAVAQNFNSATDQPRNTLSNAAQAGQVVTCGLRAWVRSPTMKRGHSRAARSQHQPSGCWWVAKPATVRYKGRSGLLFGGRPDCLRSAGRA